MFFHSWFMVLLTAICISNVNLNNMTHKHTLTYTYINKLSESYSFSFYHTFLSFIHFFLFVRSIVDYFYLLSFFFSFLLYSCLTTFYFHILHCYQWVNDLRLTFDFCLLAAALQIYTVHSQRICRVFFFSSYCYYS